MTLGPDCICVCGKCKKQQGVQDRQSARCSSTSEEVHQVVFVHISLLMQSYISVFIFPACPLFFLEFGGEEISVRPFRQPLQLQEEEEQQPESFEHLHRQLPGIPLVSTFAPI